jgi:hypothetical protein
MTQFIGIVSALWLLAATPLDQHNGFFEATLDAAHVVPPTSSSGSAQITWYWRDQESYTYLDIQYAGLSSSVTGLFAAIGTDSENGPILRTFSYEYFPSPFTIFPGYPLEDYSALMDSSVYIVITTVSYPNGEIRGRFIPNHLPATKRVSWGTMRSLSR